MTITIGIVVVYNRPRLRWWPYASFALKSYGASEMAQEQLINWIEVDSSNIKHVGYEEDSRCLFVRFHNGGLYVYDDVDMEVFMSLQLANSVGSYFNNAVKAAGYSYVKCVDEADLAHHIISKQG